MKKLGLIMLLMFGYAGLQAALKKSTINEVIQEMYDLADDMKSMGDVMRGIIPIEMQNDPGIKQLLAQPLATRMDFAAKVFDPVRDKMSELLGKLLTDLKGTGFLSPEVSALRISDLYQ